MQGFRALRAMPGTEDVSCVLLVLILLLLLLLVVGASPCTRLKIPPLSAHLTPGDTHCLGLPRWLSSKESACQCRRHKRHVSDPWVGKIPWRRKHNPLRYSCLENSMDRGAWWATVHGVAKSQTRLSDERFEEV